MWASWPATVSRCRVGAWISFKAAQPPGSFIAAAIRFSMSLFDAQANQMTPRMLAHARAINGSTGEKTDWSFVRFQTPLHLTCKRCSGSWR